MPCERCERLAGAASRLAHSGRDRRARRSAARYGSVLIQFYWKGYGYRTQSEDQRTDPYFTRAGHFRRRRTVGHHAQPKSAAHALARRNWIWSKWRRTNGRPSAGSWITVSSSTSRRSGWPKATRTTAKSKKSVFDQRRANTTSHFKVNQARTLLQHKDKVVVSVIFRGRELAHIEEGRKVIDKSSKSSKTSARSNRLPRTRASGSWRSWLPGKRGPGFGLPQSTLGAPPGEYFHRRAPGCVVPRQRTSTWPTCRRPALRPTACRFATTVESPIRLRPVHRVKRRQV